VVGATKLLAMIASMPMYDLPEVATNTDRIWRSIAALLRVAGIDAPDEVSRDLPDLMQHWVDPNLLLSHTCGYPVVSELDGKVSVVGSWATVVDEPTRPGWYRTSIVVRENDKQADDLHAYVRSGLRLAANGPESLSGWVSLSEFVDEQCGLADALLAHESSVRITGAHINSLAAVQRGEADLASIDPWSYWLFEKWRPAAVAGLRTIGHGPLVAITPLITYLGGPVEALRKAAASTVADLELRPSLDALGIVGFVPHGIEAHDPVRAIAERYEPSIGLLRRC
jgi:ABC-type phosphate/phosphonate transport system substrate-binding protein